MENLFTAIRKQYPAFSKVEKKIADYILNFPEKAIHLTVARFGQEVQVSDGSVINFANTMGYSGFSALKLAMAQSLSNQEQMLLKDCKKGENPSAVLGHLTDEIIQGFRMAAAGIDNETLELAAQLLIEKKRIEIYGVGSSSMLAQDAYYRFMRQGLPALAVTDAHMAAVSASFLDTESVVLAISHSGRTIETLQAVKIAKSKGAAVLSVTSYPDSPLAQISDVVLLSTSRESGDWKEAMITRYIQLLLMDSLLMYISLKDPSRSLQNIENMEDIIGEHRI